VNDDIVSGHFEAIRKLLEPYRGNRIVDGFPSALSFVVQAHIALPTSDNRIRMRLLADLDAVTAMVGMIGDIVSPEIFERLKFHYAEIQHFASKIGEGVHP